MDRTQFLAFEVEQQVTLETLTSGVVRSSAIEGEVLDPRVVRSSVARQVGMSEGGLPSGDRHIEGRDLVALDSTRYCEQALTGEGFLGRHAALFPTGRRGLDSITPGAWRTDPVATPYAGVLAVSRGFILRGQTQTRGA